MPLRPLVSATLLTFAALVPASAAEEWSYSEIAGAAGAAPMHLAVTARQYHGVGLRCEAGTLSVQYLTNDPMGPEEMAKINAGGVRLSVRLGGETTVLAGEMQRVPQGAVLVALAEPSLLTKVEKAKGVLDLSIEFEGASSHARSFTLEGAAEALSELRESCLS